MRIALALAASLALAGVRAAEVVQPRAFGHVLGDVLAQRIRLDGFAPGALPEPARVGAWFERRGARIETAADGARWLVVDYQVVNVPAVATSLQLPAWDVPAAAGAPLRVPAAPLAVAPLLPAAGDVFELRPDRPAPLVDTAPLGRALAEGLAATGALALAWAAWWGWRERRARSSLPFAQAGRALRDADEEAAWRCLHAAFDRTAGEVLRPATLAALFERAPHLAPERAAIERFYAQSSARFFGQAEAPPAPRALCRALRRLERAHER